MNCTAELIEKTFENNSDDLAGVVSLSKKIRSLIQIIDPFIQQSTLEVCPACTKNCCINRHAYYNCDDFIYLFAVGIKPQEFDEEFDEEPCRFWSPRGCALERIERPSGCNWYFCSPLYDAMIKAPEREYKDFSDHFDELCVLWMEMVSEFRSKFRELNGYEVEITNPQNN